MLKLSRKVPPIRFISEVTLDTRVASVGPLKITKEGQ